MRGAASLLVGLFFFMLGAADLLSMRQTMAEPKMPQAPSDPDFIWGTTPQRARLHFGGRWIEPTDPMYDLIQRIMIQQFVPSPPAVQGAQG